MSKTTIPHPNTSRQPVRGRAFAGYTVEIDSEDSKTSVLYRPTSDGRLARFTYRAFRIPSQRRFVIRHFHDATAADRAETEEFAPLIGALYNRNRNVVTRYRRNDGTYGFVLIGGTFVDDPLVQLELEMMIDLSSGVSA